MIELMTLLVFPLFSQVPEIHFQKIYDNPRIVWGFEFLEKDKILITHRNGDILLFDNKSKKTEGLSHSFKIAVIGQGGLLDVIKDTEYEKNHTIYFTYSTPNADGSKFSTRLSSAKFENNKLSEFNDLYTANAWSPNFEHFGSRLAIDKNFIYITIGERNEREKAQRLDCDNGKIIQFNRKTTKTEILSFGHRNPQGIAIHPITKDLWETEHGPKGGDEINLIKKGHNYGWPIYTYGLEYSGKKISEKSTSSKIESPVHQWTPSMGPSSLMIYSGKKFSKFKGNFFIGGLAIQYLSVIKMEGNKYTSERKLGVELNERIRQVKEDTSTGDIYFSTDSGKIYELY